MKTVLSILIFGIVAQALGSPLTAAATSPNIILILAGDVGVYGATLIDTPHLDRLADEGVRFTNFYASANVCSPSHIPLVPSPAFANTSRAGAYGDVVQELDWSVGRLLDAVRSNGLADNTVIVFTSDNGPFPEGSTGGLPGAGEGDRRTSQRHHRRVERGCCY